MGCQVRRLPLRGRSGGIVSLEGRGAEGNFFVTYPYPSWGLLGPG